MMNEIFEVLRKSQEVNEFAADLVGRVRVFASNVTSVNDPENLRRVKVNDPNKPDVDTPWLARVLPYPDFDPPLPEVGETVLVVAIGDDITKATYQPLVNRTNPPLPKNDVVKDWHDKVPGDRESRTDGDSTINIGKSLTLQTDSGAKIILSESGSITLESADGSTITLGSGITLATDSATLGGKQIVTLTAQDNAGHTIVTKGW